MNRYLSIVWVLAVLGFCSGAHAAPPPGHSPRGVPEEIILRGTDSEGNELALRVPVNILMAHLGGLAQLQQPGNNASVNLNQIGGSSVSSALYDSGNTALKVNCIVGCSAAGSFTDNSAFTTGSTSVTNVSGLFNDTATNLTSGNAGAIRATTDRMLFVNIGKIGGTAPTLTGSSLNVNCTGGCSGSAGFTDNSAFTAGTTAETNVGGVFNDGLTALTSGNAAAARITPNRGVHANLRNNSGTEIATSANPLRIDPTGTTTQPVSGTVTANAGTGTFTVGGTVTANQGTANTLANAWPAKITDATNGPAAVKAASTAAVAGDPALVVAVSPNNTVAATESGTWTVQPGNTQNTTPWLSNAFVSQIIFNDVVGADMIAPLATPFIDGTNSPNLQRVTFLDGFTAVGSQPLYVNGTPGSVTTFYVARPPSSVISNVPYTSADTASAQYSNSFASALNSGRFFYQMATPAAPGVAVSAGGSVPLGAQQYQITAVDTDGKESVISSIATATTASGIQTVTVTPPALPAGAIGWKAYRNQILANIPGCATIAPTATFVDTFSFTCGNSIPVPQAGSTLLSTNGVSTYKSSLNGINWQNWPYSDVSASANSGAAIGLLLANGGAVNAPPHYRETFTSHINLGSGTQPVKYLLGQDSLVTCNVTDASYCFKVFNASSMAGSSFGALGSRNGGSVLNTLGTTNVASLVTNDQSTQSEYFSLENLFIDNSASGTVTSLLDLGNIFVPSRIRDVTLVGGSTGTTNAINFHGSSTAGENGGDVTFDNDWVNCASGTSCTPLNITNTNGGSVQRLTFHSGAYEHPGNTLPVVNADGSTGGGIYGLNFESNRFEGNSADTSTSFAKFNNINQVTMLSPFFLPLSGGSTQYGAELSGTINGFVLINGRNSTGNMVKNNITSRNVQATYVPLYVYGTSYFDGALNLNAEAISSAPRTGCLNTFLPGALTSAWTGTTCTLDKAVTVTRIQVQAKTAPSGCGTNAVVRVSDGTTPQTVTVSAAANDSGALTQNYAAGAVIAVSVSTAASGCGTNPADANVSVQYRMQ